MDEGSDTDCLISAIALSHTISWGNALVRFREINAKSHLFLPQRRCPNRLKCNTFYCRRLRFGRGSDIQPNFDLNNEGLLPMYHEETT